MNKVGIVKAEFLLKLAQKQINAALAYLECAKAEPPKPPAVGPWKILVDEWNTIPEESKKKLFTDYSNTFAPRPYHFEGHVFGMPRPERKGMNHVAPQYRVCERCGRSDVSLANEGWPKCK